jgi:hypothetical protein
MTKTLSMILHQNYLCYNNRFYKPDKGVTKGSPISSIYAEIFLQYYENILIKYWLDTKIVSYYRMYVDDNSNIQEEQMK